MQCQQINYEVDFPICFLGPEKSFGALPAFFYLALSAEDSLSLEPYNQPALFIASSEIRVFSFTLPGHEPGLDKHHAMQFWAEKMAQGINILEDFFNKAIKAIDFLIEQGWIKEEAIAIGGLSRGGFIATHLAARHSKITSLLNFAPLTCLEIIEEFIPYRQDLLVESMIKEMDLKNWIGRLLHLKNVRIYIGNRDIRVSTDACYQLIKSLVELFHEKRLRKTSIELIITQSIGHKGHGTSREKFMDGATWLKQMIQENHA